MIKNRIQGKEEKCVTIFSCEYGIKTKLRFMWFMKCKLDNYFKVHLLIV